MSDFEKYFESKYSTYTECNKNMLRGVALEAYEAGRKAGLEEAVVLVEKCKSNACCDLGEDWWEYSVDIAAAIRERITE